MFVLLVARMRMPLRSLVWFAVATFVGSALGQAPAAKSPRDALQPFGDLVGTWRGTGTPSGTREEQRTGFWVETLAVEWRFKGDAAWLTFAFDKSKRLRSAELHPRADGRYEFRVVDAAGAQATLVGSLQGRTLAVENAAQRYVFTLLHDNRFLYRHEERLPAKETYAKRYQVGATKEGVPFASGDGQPECIVSGGLAKTPVTYQGKTYYVCCSGCRDEFNANPEKYVREAEAKKK